MTDPLYTCNGTPGWRQVVFINMTDNSYNCPPGLQLASHSKRTCGRAHTGAFDCSSTAFSIGGSEYSRVCGRIIGYQFGPANALNGYYDDPFPLIDGYHIDGVSLTHGDTGRRQHIWSFIAGLTEFNNSSYATSQCPCDVHVSSEAKIPPSFVGNDYFCESGVNAIWPGRSAFGKFFPDDPLWDGQNCTSISTCCEFNNPPWFTKTLPSTTTDDIELRLCQNNGKAIDDTPLELIELYIK